MMRYGGIEVFETETAKTKPPGKPHCDDMRAMIEHFEKLGLIFDVPAALHIGNKVYMHPFIYSEFKRRVRNDEAFK